MFNDPKNKELVKMAYEKMEEAIKSGANCLRLNFSHGSYEEHGIRVKIARDVAEKLKQNISLMLDTKGPEIRITNVVNGPIPINKGTDLTIYCTKIVDGGHKQFSVSDSTGKYNMAKDVKVGGTILVDDGKLNLRINKVNADTGEIEVTSLNSHAISTNKRINLPNTEYSMPFLSDKDKEDLLFAIKNKFDYVAASFTNTQYDLRMIKDFIKNNGGTNLQVVAKIETSQAIKNIDQIIDEADGIMVARGDLALEIPYYEVPYYQKYIIRKCRFVAKPCIVATQMLDSLEKNIHPTRAEVTDVFFAVERGADATMLSGESAQGLFPIEAITTMHNINIKSELLFDYQRAID
jgi:pyruvate kinase